MISINLLGQNGTLKGTLTDGINGTKSEHITIDLELNDKVIKTLWTDSLGSFEFKYLEKGNYKLRLSFIGYQDFVTPNIYVNEDSMASLELIYPCPNGNNKPKKICPHGHRNKIVPIVYGLPTRFTMLKAKLRIVSLGGCIIPVCPPHWYCKKHEIEF